MRTFLAIVALLSLSPRGAAQTGPDAGKATSSSGSAAAASRREAGGIVADRCVACHGPGKRKGGLDLSRRSSALAGGESGVVILPGRPAESLLVEKVSGGEMPPKGPLSREEIAAVRAWVEA